MIVALGDCKGVEDVGEVSVQGGIIGDQFRCADGIGDVLPVDLVALYEGEGVLDVPDGQNYCNVGGVNHYYVAFVLHFRSGFVLEFKYSFSQDETFGTDCRNQGQKVFFLFLGV